MGLSEIMAAQTTVATSLAILDLALLGTDFTINEVLINELNQTAEGRQFLDNFNKFVLIYGGARVYTELTGLASEMRASATALNDAEVIDLTSQISAKAVKSSGVLDNAFLAGWDEAKVLAKKPRPAPSTYLNPAFISQTLNTVNQEGVGFIAVKSWIEGSGFTTFPFRKFAMLKSDINNAITQYRATKDIKILEESLGYDGGALSGFEDELYVFYADNTKYNFDIPNGNEAGANKYWIPGSYTPTGATEVVIIDKKNPVQPIIHNKSIEYLKQNFPFEKVKTF